VNKRLASFKAKEGFEALFKRYGFPYGSANYIFSELTNIYPLVKISMEKFKNLKTPVF